MNQPPFQPRVSLRRAFASLRDIRLLLACILAIALFAKPQHLKSVATTSARAPGIAQPIRYQSDYFFGGRRLHGMGTSPILGPASPRSWTSFLPFAALPQAAIASCLATVPGAAKAPRIPRDIADDLPGLYGAPWVAPINSHLIAILHVTVARQAAWQPPEPVLQIYRQGAATPEFSKSVPVSVTRGKSALLYRIFPGGPITCIDLVIPNGAGAGTAHVYYPFRGHLWDAEGIFTVQR